MSSSAADKDEVPNKDLTVNGTTSAEFFSSTPRELSNGGKLTVEGKKMLNVWNYGRQRNVLLITTILFAVVAVVAIVIGIVSRRRQSAPR